MTVENACHVIRGEELETARSEANGKVGHAQHLIENGDYETATEALLEAIELFNDVTNRGAVVGFDRGNGEVRVPLWFDQE